MGKKVLATCTISQAAITYAAPALKTFRRLSSPQKDMAAPGALIVAIYGWLDLNAQNSVV
jgi:hypothetical protein